MKFNKKFLALALSSLVLGGCFSDSDDGGLAALPAGDMLVLTATNQLISYDKTQPSSIRTSVTISGLTTGDSIVGIDFRPRDGLLYAVTRTATGEGRLYTINRANGAATVVATLTAHPTDASDTYTGLAIAPATFAVDFNPMADALRVISSTGQNLRVVLNATPATTPPVPVGATFTDGPINGAAADISGAGYTNSFDGTTSTRLFNINATTDTLTLQNPPNDGTQVVAAPLGVDATGSTAFDIDARNNRGFALMSVGGTTGLYTIAIPDSTATLPTAAAATLVGALNVPNPVVGFVLIQPTAPQAIALDGNTAGTQRLLKFGIRNPNAATATAITGLPTGERLLSIDYRPSNGKVYGLSSAGKVFTIDPDTGAATLGSTLSISAAIVNGLAAGKNYAIDINPAADALRIVSSPDGDGASKNYRVAGANLETTGTTVTDTDLTLGGVTTGFGIGQIAYANNFANPTPASTRMFDIDADNNRLLQQVPPNDGTLTVIGATGMAFNDYGGFDISGGDNGMVLMANRVGATGAFSLFTATLGTGATLVAGVSTGTAEIGTGATLSTDIRALTVKY